MSKFKMVQPVVKEVEVEVLTTTVDELLHAGQYRTQASATQSPQVFDFIGDPAYVGITELGYLNTWGITNGYRVYVLRGKTHAMFGDVRGDRTSERLVVLRFFDDEVAEWFPYTGVMTDA